MTQPSRVNYVPTFCRVLHYNRNTEEYRRTLTVDGQLSSVRDFTLYSTLRFDFSSTPTLFGDFTSSVLCIFSMPRKIARANFNTISSLRYLTQQEQNNLHP